METKENFLPPASLQRLAELTNNMSKCFVQQSEHLEGAEKESMAISWGKSVKCLPALRHKYHSVKYRDNATGARLLSSRQLQQPQYPLIHQHSWSLRTQQMRPLRCREMSGNIYPVTRRHVPFCVLRISFFRALPTASVCPSVPFILLTVTD